MHTESQKVTCMYYVWGIGAMTRRCNALVTCAGTRAVHDVTEDLVEEKSLIRATVHAALLSAIPFGIASIGMLVRLPLSLTLRGLLQHLAPFFDMQWHLLGEAEL